MVNLLGLTIGISAFVVIYIIVSYDGSFDKFHKDGDRIYRVVSTLKTPKFDVHSPGVPMPMARMASQGLTGAEMVVPFRLWLDNVKVSIPKANDQVAEFKEQPDIIFADTRYFNMVHYNWLAGSPATAFEHPYQVVLTRSNAKLYFPQLAPAEVIGRQFFFNDTIAVTVSGVVADIEKNTEFIFKTFISLASLETHTFRPADWDDWASYAPSTQLFVKLSEGTTPVQVQDQITRLFNKHAKKDFTVTSTPFSLQLLKDIHFDADFGNYGTHVANHTTLTGLLLVAVFLLLLGCINFINLTTAQSVRHAKEIGVRKVIGGSRLQLVLQLLTETFVLTLLATILSVILTPLFLKLFEDYTPPGLHFSLFDQPGIILIVLGVALAVSLLSGLYPAIISSSYQPVLVLTKQSTGGRRKSAWLRKSLTVTQFIIAQVFILATLLVSKQIRYSLNKDLGFKKDAIISVDVNSNDTLPLRKNLFLSKLRSIPEIANVSLSSDLPSSYDTYLCKGTYLDGTREIETNLQVKFADTNYIRLYQIKLLAGSNLPASDSLRYVLINESYAKLLGFATAEEAIGKFIATNLDHKTVQVKGVVQNFHQKSLHEIIQPLIIGSSLDEQNTVNILLQPQNMEGTVWKTTIGKIQRTWNEIYPGEDFEYAFFDESIARYYEAEQRVSYLLVWATTLS
ncbi:MAG TPA: ABC transporter permease, partial [Flavipsychrobacter sp.]|nr:ABC transporter permease [Flavipsychrobacter sp.]